MCTSMANRTLSLYNSGNIPTQIGDKYVTLVKIVDYIERVCSIK